MPTGFVSVIDESCRIFLSSIVSQKDIRSWDLWRLLWLVTSIVTCNYIWIFLHYSAYFNVKLSDLSKKAVVQDDGGRAAIHVGLTYIGNNDWHWTDGSSFDYMRWFDMNTIRDEDYDTSNPHVSLNTKRTWISTFDIFSSNAALSFVCQTPPSSQGWLFKKLKILGYCMNLYNIFVQYACFCIRRSNKEADQLNLSVWLLFCLESMVLF